MASSSGGGGGGGSGSGASGGGNSGSSSLVQKTTRMLDKGSKHDRLRGLSGLGAASSSGGLSSRKRTLGPPMPAPVVNTAPVLVDEESKVRKKKKPKKKRSRHARVDKHDRLRGMGGLGAAASSGGLEKPASASYRDRFGASAPVCPPVSIAPSPRMPPARPGDMYRFAPVELPFTKSLFRDALRGSADLELPPAAAPASGIDERKGNNVGGAGTGVVKMEAEDEDSAFEFPKGSAAADVVEAMSSAELRPAMLQFPSHFPTKPPAKPLTRKEKRRLRRQRKRGLRADDPVVIDGDGASAQGSSDSDTDTTSTTSSSEDEAATEQKRREWEQLAVARATSSVFPEATGQLEQLGSGHLGRLLLYSDGHVELALNEEVSFDMQMGVQPECHQEVHAVPVAGDGMGSVRIGEVSHRWVMSLQEKNKQQQATDDYT